MSISRRSQKEIVRIVSLMVKVPDIWRRSRGYGYITYQAVVGDWDVRITKRGLDWHERSRYSLSIGHIVVMKGKRVKRMWRAREKKNNKEIDRYEQALVNKFIKEFAHCKKCDDLPQSKLDFR